MIEWEQLLGRPHFCCAVTTAPIEPGDRFYTVLRWHNGNFQRVDVSETAWDEQLTEGSLGWWCQTRPLKPPVQGQRFIAPELLKDFFHDCIRSEERPRQCLGWLLAWLLIRERHLRYHDLMQSTHGAILVVQDRSQPDPSLLRIRDPGMSEEELVRLEEQLPQLFAS